MIVFTKKQGETNYNLNNVEYILYNIQHTHIADLIRDNNSVLSVIGDIHKSQYISGNIYPWFTIEGHTNGQMVLPKTHIYVCYRPFYLYYNQRFSECQAFDDDVPRPNLDLGNWEFVNMTIGNQQKFIQSEYKYKEKRQKTALKIIDPKTNKPI